MAVTIRHVTPQQLLGQRLRQHRKKAKLTQPQLAAMLECHQSRVSKVEAGALQLGVVDFVMYCNAIGADPITLLRLIMN
jgi:transcriptional regulator with XRE-family HTH domain